MEFEVVATPYLFLEAPRADGETLWFTDLLLGGLYRLKPNRTLDVFLEKHTHIGGVAINEDGRVICGGREGLLWLDPNTRESGVVLDQVDGRKLSGVNDMYPDGKGGLYFGTLSRAGEYGEPPTLTAMYHLDAGGRARLIRDGCKFSNGIGLSPDGRRLYHNESLLATFVYDVRPDGTVENRTVFCSKDDCDGLAVDSEGGVWIAYFNTGELIRYRPDGSVDHHVPLPHRVITSLCFGGRDQRDLWVTTAGNEGIEALLKGIDPPREAAVYHARSDVAGASVARTRFSLPQKAWRSPRIPLVEREQYTAQQAELAKGRDQYNLTRMFLQHPQLYRVFVPFLERLMSGSSLPPRAREILILRALGLCEESYERDHHVQIARQVGISATEIDNALSGASTSGTASDNWLLQAAAELVNQRTLSDATWQALSKDFSAQQMIEVVFVVGAYTMVSMATNSFNMPLDRPATATS
jgi:D-xylonolactonase